MSDLVDTMAVVQNFKEGGVLLSGGNRSATVDAKRLWRLSIFFCLCAAITWTVWLWPLKKQGWLTLFVWGERFDFPFILMKLAIGNCLPGIVAVI